MYGYKVTQFDESQFSISIDIFNKMNLVLFSSLLKNIIQYRLALIFI